MNIIKFENACKSFGDVKVLKNINLEIKKGDVVSIIGPSGSGKSTLLRCIVDLETIEEGSIIINDLALVKDGVHSDKKVKAEILKESGMVFQSFNLFPHMTAIENVIFALLKVDNMPRKDALARGKELLERVGLGDKIDAFPKSLSGGQKQRVAIARALARKPEILLFDEPTSALDPELVNEVLSVIEDLKDLDITMVIVSHEMNFVKKISDKVIFMDGGNIVKYDTAKEVFNSDSNDRINQFLKTIHN